MSRSRLEAAGRAIPERRKGLWILGGIELAGPKNFGAVDFRCVVDPFVVKIVIFFVAHHDQVLAGSVRECFCSGRAAGISLAGPFQWVADTMRGRGTNIGREETEDSPGK